MSTIKVNKIENTATADGGISIDASGHVQVDGVQLPTTGQLSNRNLIINGAMHVAQRGTSSTDSGYRTVDRMRPAAGQVSVTQSQQTLSSGSPYDEGFRYFMRGAVTTTSSATNAYFQIETRLEAQDIAQSGWKYKDSSRDLVCSFWARSSLAGTYYVQYRANDVTNFHFNRSFTLAADTWTKIEQTIPGHSSLVFDNNTDTGLTVVVTPHYGTSYTDSGVAVDSWFLRSGENYFPDFAQNWANTSSATFDLTGLQLEVGSKATPFEHRSFGDDLARCQRYFARSYAYGTATGSSTSLGCLASTAYAAAAYASAGTAVFPVEMRATPTVTIYGTGGTAGKVNADSGEANGVATDINTRSCFIYRNNDATGVSVNVFMKAHYVAAAEL